MRDRLLPWILLLACLGGACADDSEDAVAASGVSTGWKTPSAIVPVDVFDGLPTGDAQLDKLCSRQGADAVSKAFCTKQGPAIHGLADLQGRLGLAFGDPTGRSRAPGDPGFALSGHSASLVGRFVSAFNPRAFVFTPSAPGSGQPTPGFVVLSFTRGENFVEVAAHDPTDPGPEAINFYLLHFQRACDSGLDPAERLTPAVERDWVQVDVYEDDDLENTVLDCKRCHQPAGPGTRKILRMHEHTDPWTHFFRSDRPGGRALLDDFHATHGTEEDYGGIPAPWLDRSDPALLAALVENNGFSDQPNPFDAAQIEREVEATNPAQPQSNSPPGRSASWQRLFDLAVTCKAAPPPYHDAKVYDATKLESAGLSYRAMLTGGRRESSDDLRDVFLEAALVDVGVRPPPRATGRAVLVETCQDCHNSTVDPSLSRARFDVERLEQMTRSEKDAAIRRLDLPIENRQRMPPAMFRWLSPDEIARVKAELAR
jgi:hypothetical protein